MRQINSPERSETLAPARMAARSHDLLAAAPSHKKQDEWLQGLEFCKAILQKLALGISTGRALTPARAEKARDELESIPRQCEYIRELLADPTRDPYRDWGMKPPKDEATANAELSDGRGDRSLQ